MQKSPSALRWISFGLAIFCCAWLANVYLVRDSSPKTNPAESVALNRLDQIGPVAYRQSPGGSVTEITIAHEEFSSVHVAQLASFPELKILHLEGSGVSDDALATLTSLPKLEHLFLDETTIGDSGIEHLASAGNSLQQLSLVGCKVTDRGLSSLAKLSALKVLNLSQTQVTDAGLKSLKDLHSLEALYLRDLPLTGAGLQLMNELPRLIKLDLSRSSLSKQHLTGFANFPQLEQLFVAGCPIDDVMMAALLEQLLSSNQNLRALTISRIPLTDAAVEPLSNLAKFPKLSLVQMQNTQITEEAFQRLAALTPEINFSVDYPIE